MLRISCTTHLCSLGCSVPEFGQAAIIPEINTITCICSTWWLGREELYLLEVSKGEAARRGVIQEPLLDGVPNVGGGL
jgi:hypothetical protein